MSLAVQLQTVIFRSYYPSSRFTDKLAKTAFISTDLTRSLTNAFQSMVILKRWQDCIFLKMLKIKFNSNIQSWQSPTSFTKVMWNIKECKVLHVIKNQLENVKVTFIRCSRGEATGCWDVIIIMLRGRIFYFSYKRQSRTANAKWRCRGLTMWYCRIQHGTVQMAPMKRGPC